jgi:iron complex transport system ATP-binding protein
MIDLQHLDIGYKTKRNNQIVFKNLHAKFELGSLIGLMGDNGIGKSTLLKTLTGYLEPLNGNIFIQNKNINTFFYQELATLISIVTTEKIGGFNLTAYDVVSLGRTPYLSLFGKLTPRDEAIIESSLTTLSIFHLKNKLMEELSDGQRQKVMIAKSLAQETPIIILDEPTAFLDYTSKHQLFQDLKRLCLEKNKLIIVSSHDIDLMQKYITHSLYLKENHHFEFH